MKGFAAGFDCGATVAGGFLQISAARQESRQRSKDGLRIVQYALGPLVLTELQQSIGQRKRCFQIVGTALDGAFEQPSARRRLSRPESLDAFVAQTLCRFVTAVASFTPEGKGAAGQASQADQQERAEYTYKKRPQHDCR